MVQLSLRLERFCHEYLLSMNATEAYCNVLARSDLQIDRPMAQRRASVLMQRPDIQIRLMELQAGLSDRYQVDLERVVDELEAIAFSTVDDFFHDDGLNLTRKSWDAIPKRKLAAISEIKETVTQHGTNVTVKFHDKLGAMEKLARLLGLFPKAEGEEHTHYVITLPPRATNSAEWLEGAQREYTALQATAARRLAVDAEVLEASR